MLKVSVFASVLFSFGTVFFSGQAFATGYFDSATKTGAGGWACNPATPGYSGWIHFWRDDGKFLGALLANKPREQAVANLCGGSGAHGFSGDFEYPASFLDNKKHTVRGYFLNQDGQTSIELQNSMQVTFSDATFFNFNVVDVDACNWPNPYANLPGWVVQENPMSKVKRCTGYNGWYMSFKMIYLGDPNIPIGATTKICGSGLPIPTGWQVVSSENDQKCLNSYTATTWLDQVSFTNVSYHPTYTLKKVN